MRIAQEEMPDDSVAGIKSCLILDAQIGYQRPYSKYHQERNKTSHREI